MTRAHTNALVGLLESDPALADNVFVMLAPDLSAYPYVIVRPGLSTDRQERLSGGASTFTPSWSVMCVGADPEQCAWVVEHVDAALRPKGRGKTPTIAGRRCQPIRRDILDVMEIDDDTSPPGFTQIAEYSFRSDPI